MLAYYGDKISENLMETPNGYLICRNVPIARTGQMEYLAQELQLPGDPDRRVSVRRDEMEVFDAAACASFEGVPVTDGHPPADICPENWAGYARGHVQNVRRQGQFLIADLHITDPILIQQILDGHKREISCGYRCSYIPIHTGQYKQCRIRGNHVAVVRKGRAGDAVAIQDAALTQNKRKKGDFIMRFFAKNMPDAMPENAADQDWEQQPEQPDMQLLLNKMMTLLDTLQQQINQGAHVITENPQQKQLNMQEILQKLRPIVAAMPNEADRRRLSDALLAALTENMPDTANTPDQDPFPAMMDAARSYAVQGSYGVASQQQDAYNARNPHRN